MKNRILQGAIFAVCLLFSVLVPTGAKAIEGTTVYIEDLTAEQNEEFEVPILLSGNTGFLNLSIEVEYDTEKLELIGVRQILTQGIKTVSPTGKYPISLIWVNATPIDYNGTLADLRFRAKECGTASIGVSFYKGRDGTYVDGVNVNYDGERQPVLISYLSGKITIGNTTTELNILYAGSQTSVKLNGKTYDTVLAAYYSKEGIMTKAKFFQPGETVSVPSGSEGESVCIFVLKDFVPVADVQALKC